MPFVLAISGFKDSGKTTLSLRLMEHFRERGIDVAFVKHSRESPLSDVSTDSGKAVNGGVPTLFWGDEGLRLERAGSFGLDEILHRFFPAADIVVVEGAKSLALPRVWVAQGGEVPEDVRGVIARYDWSRTESRLEDRLFGSGGEAELASFIVDLWRKAEPTGFVLYGGTRRIPAKAFVADFISGGVRGMVRALKGGSDPSQELSLFIRGEEIPRGEDES